MNGKRNMNEKRKETKRDKKMMILRIPFRNMMKIILYNALPDFSKTKKKNKYKTKTNMNKYE